MVISYKMRRLAFIFVFLLGTLHLLHGQPWLIQGSIENAEEGQVLLAFYYGDRFTVLDSIDTSSGFFYFMLPEDIPPGIFRIIYADRVDSIRNQNRFVEFIFNRENIEIYIASQEPGPVPYFENSVENLVYKEFVEFELEYEAQLMSVYGQLEPKMEGIGNDAADRYMTIQNERISYMDSITRLYPDLYAVRIMNAFRAPLIPGELSHQRRIDTLKECFFDLSAIDDPMLLYAPVYSFKIVDYLSLYKDYNLPMIQQEEAFMEAVDWIMLSVSREEELRSFVVEFLLEGFELLQMEQVQMHLADHYLDESCESDIVELVLSRMEGYKKMTPGQPAPDFILRDVEGNNFQLSELDHKYVLVLFWSSTCEGCRKLLPQLHNWYISENDYDLEVVAISIDTSVVNFEYLYNQMHPSWISVHDPLGWNGMVPSDYQVYATPSLFLLDRERTILARPGSFRQFQRVMKKQSP